MQYKSINLGTKETKKTSYYYELLPIMKVLWKTSWSVATRMSDKIGLLEEGDGLLIAGKGHETEQIVGENSFPFDDFEQASLSVASLDGIEKWACGILKMQL